MDIHKLFKPLLFISLGIMVFSYTAWYFDLSIYKSMAFMNMPFTLCCNIIALVEIYRSDKTGLAERIMWTLVFLYLSLFIALIYFYLARPRILRKYKLLNTCNESPRLLIEN
jgi:hypothetical protein